MGATLFALTCATCGACCVCCIARDCADPEVDCINNVVVNAYWTGFTPPSAGALAYIWALADGSFFPVTEADSNAARATLSWTNVTLAQA